METAKNTKQVFYTKSKGEKGTSSAQVETSAKPGPFKLQKENSSTKYCKY